MTTTTSALDMYEAEVGTLQAVLDALDGLPRELIINVFHDGTNYVAVYRKRR